jgi:hypothetical protein
MGAEIMLLYGCIWFMLSKVVISAQIVFSDPISWRTFAIMLQAARECLISPVIICKDLENV